MLITGPCQVLPHLCAYNYSSFAGKQAEWVRVLFLIGHDNQHWAGKGFAPRNKDWSFIVGPNVKLHFRYYNVARSSEPLLWHGSVTHGRHFILQLLLMELGCPESWSSYSIPAHKEKAAILEWRCLPLRAGGAATVGCAAQMIVLWKSAYRDASWEEACCSGIGNRVCSTHAQT